MDNSLNYERIKSSMEYIVENFKLQPKIQDIASHVHLSEFHFQRIFKEWAGVTPKKFLQFITLNALKDEINQSNSIAELSYKIGLSAPSRVYDLFVNIESVTPYEYKTKGMGIEIEYGIQNSPFGLCMIANTKRGVCAIEFIDNNESEVVSIFKQKWENATIIENQLMANVLIDQIFGSMRTPINVLLFGTPFQIKVWEALLNIPFGQLTNYNKIASLINNPNASRAVGTAIGKNNLAFLIPCHRVIRSLGGLGGYKWKESRKLSMIGWEKAKVCDKS